MDDQLAAGVLWREVARRSASSNRGSELGAALSEVATAIAEDVETFRGLMDRLGFRQSRFKPVLALLAERIGRLKPNARLVSYSPLSRFEELEFLVMGIEGKRVLWQTLGQAANLSERLGDVDFEALQERAEAQRARLEPFRLKAGADALRAA
jgi:hypothetical protein